MQPPSPRCARARTFATSRSSPTSTTARPRSSTPCCGSPAPSGPTRRSPTGSWTRTTSSARRGSRSSPRTPRSQWGGVTLNIVDTPGHADFGGEVERALTMVDGIVLLVDAAEGPLPQTRFVLRKALAYDMPVILVINKVDRPDARISEVVDEVYELFMDLEAKDHQLDFPIVYCSGRDGWASLDPDRRRAPTWRRCATSCSTTIPAPTYTEGAPLQAWVTNLDANPYLGRLALCRVVEGTIRKGQQVAWCRTDGSIQRTKVVELYLTKQLTRVPVDAGRPWRPRRRRRHRRDHDRRDARRSRRSAPAAGDHRRRAGAGDDDRHQHLAAGRPRRHQAHGAPAQEPARRRAGRQRQHPRQHHRPSRRLGSAGPRRAAAGGARRDDAPRGLRAHGRQARGRHQDDRRPPVRAGRAGHDRHPRRLPRRRHPAARRPQGPDGEHDQPRPRLGAAWSTSCRPVA